MKTSLLPIAVAATISLPVMLVYSKGWKDAQGQIISLQGSGETVDNLTVDGHGTSATEFGHSTPSKRGARASGKKYTGADAKLDKDNVSDFFGKTKGGKQIKVENGGTVTYTGCNVGEGTAGNEFLSTSAKAFHTRTKGYTKITAWKRKNNLPQSWSDMKGRLGDGDAKPENQKRELSAQKGKKWVPAEKYEKVIPAPKTEEKK